MEKLKEQKEKDDQLLFVTSKAVNVNLFTLLPSHLTRASCSPRFRLSLPKIGTKLRLFCRLYWRHQFQCHH